MHGRLAKGDLVRLKGSSDPLIRLALDIPEQIYGVLLQCRYKKDIYLFSPANNPYASTPYWIEGKYLERAEDS